MADGMAQPQTDAPAIRAQDLTKVFGEFTAVDKVSLEVRKGEIFGIVGPDGAGKTTLMRMLAGIMDPSGGSAAITGFDTRTRAFAVKDNLAYMSQRFGLYPDLTVMENILFYADLYGVSPKGRKARMDKLLGFSHMAPFIRRRAGDLSGGMKQKLQLICALVHTPAVLLLDEPTNGVDPVSRRDFWRILYDIVAEGVSILVTTAYLDEAERCDRIGLLNQGKLLTSGTVAQIKSPMQGKVLSVKSPDTREMSRLLQNSLANASVAIFGDRIRMVCEDPKAAIQTARNLIRKAGLPEPEFKEALPGLEDIFVNMMAQPQDKPPKHLSWTARHLTIPCQNRQPGIPARPSPWKASPGFSAALPL